MSRIDYSDDDQMIWLWMGTAKRAIEGKRGQKVLRELKASLEALPEKKLIYGQVCNGEGVCAVGALAMNRLMQIGKSREEAMAILQKKYPAEEWEDAPERTGKDLFITRTLCWEIMEKNEGHRMSGSKVTDEDRYNYVLDWVNKHIKEAS